MIEFLNYKVAPLYCVVSVAVPSKLRCWGCIACAVEESILADWTNGTLSFCHMQQIANRMISSSKWGY